MQILIIKTSSMGDVIHALPAIDAIHKHFPQATIDWVVEPEFAEIPKFNKAIRRVIAIPLRKFRKNMLQALLSGELKQAVCALTADRYDKIIDLQGLLKSAVLARIAKLNKQGLRIGLDRKSIREPLAAYFYDETIRVFKNQHAIIRNMELCAKALGYPLHRLVVDYGVDINRINNQADVLINRNLIKGEYVVFFHGTTWDTKLWPKLYWLELAKKITQNKINIYVTWATKEQLQFVQELANISEYIHILPTMNILQAAKLILGALAVVGVDTGFCHLAAALDKYTIAIFGATDPRKTAPLGKQQIYLVSKFACAPCLSRKCQFVKYDAHNSGHNIFPPCLQEITPEVVWNKLSEYILK